MKLTALIRASKRQFLFGAVMWGIGAPLMFYALFQGMPTLYFIGLMTMAVGTGIVARCLRQAAGK
ncbi:hypothetical protein ACFYPG_14455 [Micromonospora sp. NPDC005553]|uniref:hypothetical protein n=1 Tax=Micromonospora sp. NPDC005553 TaxID=3364232 RepID=UPI00367B4251